RIRRVCDNLVQIEHAYDCNLEFSSAEGRKHSITPACVAGDGARRALDRVGQRVMDVSEEEAFMSLKKNVKQKAKINSAVVMLIGFALVVLDIALLNRG